eukprot:SAG11_NODE_1224_length_5481_cov_3.755853_4_plen_90_part_00
MGVLISFWGHSGGESAHQWLNDAPSRAPPRAIAKRRCITPGAACSLQVFSGVQVGEPAFTAMLESACEATKQAGKICAPSAQSLRPSSE